MDLLINAIILVIGLVFVYSGILGLQGKQIGIPAGRGPGIRYVAGTPARVAGVCFLLLGVGAIWAALAVF